MAKKTPAPVVFKPLSPTLSQIPSNVQSKISQIPPYEDSGVLYRGKFKTQQSSSEYELKGQQPKYFYQATNGATTGFITRSNTVSIFYCSAIVLTWFYGAGTTAQPFNLYDGYFGIGGISPQFQMTVPRKDEGGILVINLPVPLKFADSQIGFDAGSGAAGGDYMNFTLLGWEEQI